MYDVWVSLNYSITQLLSNAVNQCHFEADVEVICLTGEKFLYMQENGANK